MPHPNITANSVILYIVDYLHIKTNDIAMTYENYIDLQKLLLLVFRKKPHSRFQLGSEKQTLV